MRLTTNQQRVLTTLQESSRPLSAYALLKCLKDDGLKAPIQVYRALDHLAEQGLVHRLESLNAYVTCAADTSHENDLRAFAICDSCGRVDEFTVPSLNQFLGGWMERNVFSLGSSTIELHGKCSTCSQLDTTGDQ